MTITIGIGLDTDTDKKGNVKVIAQIVKPSAMKESGGSEESGGSSGGSKKKAYFNLASSGSNTFEAIRGFTNELNFRLYQAHAQVFVIGKKLAEEGIEKFMDFFIRATETRPLTKIVIADGTAADALSIDPQLEKLPAVQIDKLVEAQQANSKSTATTLQQYINTMESKTSGYFAPLIKIEENMGTKYIAVRGLAVFKQDKMVGELGEDESRGLLWVKNLVQSGVISVKVEDGEVAIEINTANCTISPEMKDGKPSVKLKIETEGELATQTGKKNVATLDGLKEIETLEQDAIKNEIYATLKKAQELNTDIFGFGEEYHKYFKKDWDDLKEKWDTLFPSLQVQVEVKAKVTATGVISKPVYAD